MWLPPAAASPSLPILLPPSPPSPRRQSISPGLGRREEGGDPEGPSPRDSRAVGRRRGAMFKEAGNEEMRVLSTANIEGVAERDIAADRD